MQFTENVGRYVLINAIIYYVIHNTYINAILFSTRFTLRNNIWVLSTVTKGNEDISKTFFFFKINVLYVYRLYRCYRLWYRICWSSFSCLCATSGRCRTLTFLTYYALYEANKIWVIRVNFFLLFSFKLMSKKMCAPS